MTIGSHTCKQELLANLKPDQQLEERLGTSIRILAYPVALRASFSPETMVAVEKAGYHAAFSYYGGVNLPKKPCLTTTTPIG